MRKITILLILIIVLPMFGYGMLVWQNNRVAPPPTQQQLAASWEKSVAWLLENRQAVLTDRNPILWWMIGESAKLSGDNRVQSLFDEFRASMNAADPNSVWQTFFTPERYWGANFSEQQTIDLPDYNQYFLFSLTCSKQLASMPLIEAQHQTNFCSKTHPFGPACITHQLMGFRFAQRVGCDRLADLPQKITALQNIIVQQLTWDPRVVDVYLQRLLMLTDSGVPARIKPRWLQRVLNAQLADGSWSNMQPLLPVGGGRYLGFNEKLMGVGSIEGNLHATAQGLWLLSLLRQKANDPEPIAP